MGIAQHDDAHKNLCTSNNSYHYFFSGHAMLPSLVSEACLMFRQISLETPSIVECHWSLSSVATASSSCLLHPPLRQLLTLAFPAAPFHLTVFLLLPNTHVIVSSVKTSKWSRWITDLCPQSGFLSSSGSFLDMRCPGADTVRLGEAEPGALLQFHFTSQFLFSRQHFCPCVFL